MNNRFCKLGQYAAKAFFLFAVCGATHSCKDDYMWDDGNPSWLGSSIYEYLDSRGHYTNFVKLINDLDYKEVLGRTGSKTLFVADDDAFQAFYENNAWGVHSYDQLTKSQKKLLLNSVMINNSYLLEMMSSTEAGDGDNAEPEKGQCLRRETATDVTDSVPHLFADDLPISYNPDDKDYWARFRNNEKGIYIALDATPTMMTHFLTTQLATKNITNEDFAIITGQTREANDAFVFDCKVIKPKEVKKDNGKAYQDTMTITCQNGYVYRLDKVLVPPQNLAEVLRTNGRTNIFSHMLDRFSAPFYNADLTARYRLLYGNDVDSVWEKRYFSERSKGNSTLYSDQGTDPVNNPNGNAIFSASNKPLPFDPGWNTYVSDPKLSKEQDMAAIFCPTDEKLMTYFFGTGDGAGGRFLVKAYAPEMLDQITETTTDLDLVYQAIDQIPRSTIRALLNNLMKESFNNTVPSKFETIKNSAQDAMFDEKDNYHRGKVLDVLLANNGVIYLMDEVTTPAEYAAVSAPAYVETDKRIFNWAIQSASLGGIPTTYYAYLLAMSSRFSFFVPLDDEFWYIDPLSFRKPVISTGDKTMTGRAYLYTWDATKNTPKVASYKYIYNYETGEGTIGDLVSTENISSTVYGNRLKDMLETHTIIHEDNTETSGIDETETGAECDKHYFYAKNNAVIYIKDAEKREKGMTVQGGWQMNTDDYSRVLAFDDKSAQTNGYGNGFAYAIDKPLIPTIESVYSAMYKNPNFSKFFELCQTDADVLTEIGITADADKLKYNIFVNNNGMPCYYYQKDAETGEFTDQFSKIADATNVRFFSNYRYTIYVPTNRAMEEAEAAGLPTWKQIHDFLELDKDPEDRTELTEEELQNRNEQAIAMATAIINFIKYHFHDNSVFADTPALAEMGYETATLNDETGTYRKVYVSSEGAGTLTVRDATGESYPVTSDKNIIVRDYITSGSGDTETLTSSSSAVLHGIDGVLNYKKLTNGRYDADWATAAKARAYLKKYRLTE